MKISWQVVLGGLILSILSGLAVVWIDQKLNGSGICANQASHKRSVTQKNALPNLNQRPQNPASAYQKGACVTNYRPYMRVGKVQVPAS